MIVRTLKDWRFKHLNESLMEQAHAEPLDASYTVKLKINGSEYDVKVQPESNNRMAILQALRTERDEEGPNFELITSGNLLSAFLEILVYQGLR